MPPISSFLSLYGAGEHYTISGETTLDGGTLNAVYDVAIASTLMGVVIKLRGKHIVAGNQLTLLDNNQTSVACSAGATYSEYSDVTQIVISPQGTNAIGGTGSSWSLRGEVTIDGNVVSVELGAPVVYGGHAVSSTPALPTEIGNSSAKLVVSTDTSRVVGNEGDKVGSVIINGTKYGLFISQLGSTISFAVKENAEGSPLAITMVGLATYEQRIEIFKRDDGTYLMSAIDLEW